jgi:hypothetical protein
MQFYDRYIQGERLQVYLEIQALGVDAFLEANFPEIEKVLNETFKRVAYNLDIIHEDLKAIKYVFNREPKYNFEKSLHKPLANTETLLNQLDNSVKPFGFVPLSLKYFYKIVGGVNFAWDYKTKEEIIWELADPIQIASLDAVVDEVTGGNWEDYISEYLTEHYENAFLNLAADSLHKDNISGGPAYAIQLTKAPSIDGSFLNEPNHTTFINYLRICFDDCGFPGVREYETRNDFLEFSDEVKPKLLLI